MEPDMNFKNSDVLVYRKVLSTLKLVLVEGTEKTILVKQGLVEGTIDYYCLPKKIAEQVIRDILLTHMHIGVSGWNTVSAPGKMGELPK